MSTEPESPFVAWHADPEYPDPLPSDLRRPEFEAVWDAIKDWDISRRPNPEGARLYSGASGNEVMHILGGLPSSSAAADQTRENIRAYLQHIADVEVGTVLSPAGRELVGFCAAWVQNRLDEKWLRDKVVPFPRPQGAPDDGISFPTLEVRQGRFAGRVRTVESAPVVLDGEPSEAELTLASVLEVVLGAEQTIDRRAESSADTAHRQSVAYARIRDLVRAKAGLTAKPAPLTESTLVGVLSAASRARKEAEETVEAIRADLEEERKHRERAELLLGAVLKEVETWETYAEDLEDTQTSMRRIRDLVAPPTVEPEVAPDAEGIVEALEDTGAYIESCLAAAPTLEAVREVVEQYNNPGNEKFGSLTAMQKITTLLAAPNAAEDATYTRKALDGTKGALKAEMLRCQAVEAKLGAIRAFARECRVCTGYNDPEVIRIFRGVATRLDALLSTADVGGSHG